MIEMTLKHKLDPKLNKFYELGESLRCGLHLWRYLHDPGCGGIFVNHLLRNIMPPSGNNSVIGKSGQVGRT